jgi:threonine dehydrogenase-like Zn-dependent dehydrogenase
VCGTDLAAFLAPAVRFPTVPNELTGETLPITMGHEFVLRGESSGALIDCNAFRFSGVIVDVGPDVDTKKWAIGKPVIVWVQFFSLHNNIQVDLRCY